MWRRWALLALLALAAAAGERPKRLAVFRKGSTFFYRLNYKVGALPYTSTFAQASGFKVGWPLPQATAGRRRQGLSALELRDGARLLYDRHGLDGPACLTRSLCQTMRLLSKQDGALAKVLHLMAGSNGANNATSLLDPLVCRNYANHCPLHSLGFAAFAQR
ncbi:uncharacterized protein LOC131665096 [Phymastichus coffea]|uniref:uncharacterized protein LOC131665096 n=1 Tax=Phymastichus coffea TaxID=108790 RepID=UPI00273C54C7|nr:uncharacterized protein LOC131665096 [Phymastichus coffea]